MKLPVIVIILVLAFPSFGQSGNLPFLGSVYFVSEASLELISAQSKSLSGIINFDQNKFAFSVTLRSFKGFNSPLQMEHFHENYLESEKFPAASYTGKLLDHLDISKDGDFVVRSKGNLTIHGISTEKILKHNFHVINRVISFESKFSILLEDFNISVPAIVNKKISEEIKITVQGRIKV